MNRKGYATIIMCFLVPLLFMGLGLVTFSMVKTRYNKQIKSSCQSQYQVYFSQVRSQIQFLQNLNPYALSLYQTQQAMIPLLWVPGVMKAYRTILKVRQRLDRMQTRLIHMFNSSNRLNSILVFSQVQRTLYQQNTKVKMVLPHASQMNYQVNPKLQITKTLNIIFPPYQPHANIHSKQAYTISIHNIIRTDSWMKFFSIQRLNENYICSASLKSDQRNNMTITYIL